MRPRIFLAAEGKGSGSSGRGRGSRKPDRARKTVKRQPIGLTEKIARSAKLQEYLDLLKWAEEIRQEQPPGLAELKSKNDAIQALRTELFRAGENISIESIQSELTKLNLDILRLSRKK